MTAADRNPARRARKERARQYPQARQEVLLETIGRITFTDPYRWLEEESEEALAWQAAQDRMAEAALCDWPGFNRLRAALARYMAPQDISAPVVYGGRWFRTVRDGAVHCLAVSKGPGQVERLLRPGPAEPADREPPAFGWFAPSPDGSLVAYGSAEGGGLQGGVQLLRLRVMEVASGRDLPLRLPHVSIGLAWLPDASGFYYIGGVAAATVEPERRLYFCDVGHSREPQPEPLRGLNFSSRPQVSSDGRYVAVVSGTREPRADYILDRASNVGWRAFLTEIPAVCFGEFEGERYVALTTLGSPRGRIVSIPVTSAGDPRTWTELIPEGTGVLRSLAVTEGRLVVGELVDACARLRVLALDGGPAHEVVLPEPGSVSTSGASGWLQSLGQPMVAPVPGGFAFVRAAYASAPAVYRYDLESQLSTGLSEAPISLDHLVWTSAAFPADDGVEIPVKLVHRGDLDLAKPRPAVIYSYGAYNFATIPGYLGVLTPFADAGGIVVFAHLRGGGEFGAEWWRAGHHQHKQRSFDDLYAVAEGLSATGLSQPDRLGVVGLSNGGVNVCVAVVQRPELFGAAVALAPQCDLVRYCRDPFCGGAPISGHHEGLHVNAGTWRDPSWGDRTGRDSEPRDPRAHFPQSMYPDPFAYSPYHNVRDGTRYPALLIQCGTEDVWCPPWHGRKFAARLQAATASDSPILLRVWQGAGHQEALEGSPEHVAEWLGFLMRQLSLEPVLWPTDPRYPPQDRRR